MIHLRPSPSLPSRSSPRESPSRIRNAPGVSKGPPDPDGVPGSRTLVIQTPLPDPKGSRTVRVREIE